MSAPRATVRKAVLAYSGGLDTSIIIPWLQETYGCEVHCLAGDVGQGEEELAGLEEKAMASGAASCAVADLRSEFLEEFVWPALRAQAVYAGRYLLGTALARPVLARAQVARAREIGADALAHGCTGKGNDQIRFELAYMALAPEMAVVAPWREWDIGSREEALAYAQARGIPVAATRQKLYSRDRNLWHLSHEGGVLEATENPPPEDVWMLTVPPERAPDRPARVRIGFCAGAPATVDGEEPGAVELVARLNALAGAHGVGRADVVEDRVVGMKSRGLYETPAGTVLHEALRSLRAVTMDPGTLRLAERLMHDYAELVYAGRWFSPEREALDAFFAAACAPVTGEVTVRLHKGSAVPESVASPRSLYAEELATFGRGEGFRHADAGGFIRLLGLPLRVAARRAKAAGAQ